MQMYLLTVITILIIKVCLEYSLRNEQQSSGNHFSHSVFNYGLFSKLIII